MSDSYIPDNEPRYILLSLEELASKKLPHAPTFRKAADEITRLRAENEKLREENDAWQMDGASCANEVKYLRAENEKLREALKPFAAEFSLYKTDFPDHFYISDLGFTFGQLRAAAAAIEGVTEPASPWRGIESAPKDKEILVFGKKDDGTDYQEVCKYYDAANCWPIVLMHGYLAPTHWMPLPEPPSND